MLMTNPERQSLHVCGVRHAFGDRSALDGVSIDVTSGELTGLLGPNGAGKTTLLRILLGVLVPDAGELEWNGHRVTAQDRQRWGYMGSSDLVGVVGPIRVTACRAG
jgi:ABC-2 type transport system ATP-binding protein